MEQLQRIFGNPLLVSAMVALIAASLLFLHGAARWSPRALRRSAVGLGVVFSLVVAYGTLRPFPSGGGRVVDLDPLDDLVDVFAGHSPAAPLVVNLALLSWVGFLLPYIASVGLGRVVLVGLAASVGIEVLQWVLAGGRVSSTLDVLLNVTGVCLGALAQRAVARAARYVDDVGRPTLRRRRGPAAGRPPR